VTISGLLNGNNFLFLLGGLIGNFRSGTLFFVVLMIGA
jgi:MFS family permease